MSNVEKLILGTVQLGISGYGINNQTVGISQKESSRILLSAKENGIQFLDTAAAYGNSEKFIGAFVKTFLKNPFKIITKFGLGQNLDSTLTQSLKSLQVEKVYGVMFHSFKDYSENRKEVTNLLSLHKGKSFEKLGVSVYTNDEIEEVLKDPRIDFIQAPFNLLDNHFQRAELFARCKSLGKEVHTRSVFLQGLFFMEEQWVPDNLKSLYKTLDEVKTHIIKEDLSIGAVALHYALSKEYIDGVLMGVDSLSQLEQNLDWLKEDIPTTLFDLVDRLEVETTHLLNPSNWIK